MSGFYADNSRIRVIETVDVNGADVDETVFDTDENMPHIIGTAEINSFEVAFPDLAKTTVYSGYDPCAYTYWYIYYYVYYDYVCESVPEQSCWSSCYYYPSYSCSEYCYNYYSLNCYSVPVSGTGTEEVCVGVDYYKERLTASESSDYYDLCDLPTDEDGTTMDVDFIVVQADGARTAAGTDPRFSENFITTVPPNTFSFQGSAFLEGAGRPNGTSFLRRIISVVLSGGKVKLRKQQSVDSIDSADTAANTTLNGNNASTYNFNFKIFFGRFKS